ncbi:MAG TPA: hypothetical protein VGB81_06615 [Devosia sp.]
MVERNFHLGRGERLSQDVVIRSGGGPKAAPYTFLEARQQLPPMLERAVAWPNALPPTACPDDRAIAALTLNPEYVAEFHFPFERLRATGMKAVGSKPRRITPQKRSKGREPEETLTAELFTMGSRQAFRHWQRAMPRWIKNSTVADDLLTIEKSALQSLRTNSKGCFQEQASAFSRSSSTQTANLVASLTRRLPTTSKVSVSDTDPNKSSSRAACV